MSSIKSEPSDGFDASNESQGIFLTDDNSHISDAFDINTSEIRPDESVINEIVLTVAYVKNESTSNALDYNTSNSKGNKCIHGQQLTEINVFKTEKTESRNDNTLRKVSDEEHCTMHVKKELQHNHIIEHGISHVKDISNHREIGESDAIGVGELCSSNTARSRNDTHTYLHSEVKRFKCDLCLCSTTTSASLKRHKLIHTGEKPFKCD